MKRMPLSPLQYFLRTATIHDWPEYPIRGILLDTSRHYLAKNLILRQIDLMAQNKMNTLHWHIVDMELAPSPAKYSPPSIQVFPLRLQTISQHFQSRMPQKLISFVISPQKGAFTPRHIYSPDVIEEILQFARLRGIRVIPEFDTPGKF